MSASVIFLLQVNAAVVPMKSTRLYSSVAPAPSRERNTGLGGEEGKEANDLASPCQASSVRHHVVVYAPDAYLPDDYEWGRVDVFGSITVTFGLWLYCCVDLAQTPLQVASLLISGMNARWRMHSVALCVEILYTGGVV